METPMSMLFSSLDKLGRVIEAPHNYKSTQGIGDRIEVEETSDNETGEVNILKWICRLAINHISDDLYETFLKSQGKV